MSGRSRHAGFGLVAVLGLIGLVGCSTPSNTPEAYDSTVETNFMNGCTETAPPANTDETGESLGEGATEQYCQCSYNWFVNNVPYGDPEDSDGDASSVPNADFAAFNFKQINSDVSDDPNAMPEAIQTALADECGTSADPGTPGSTTPTTAGEEVDPDNDSTTTSVPG